MKTILVTGGAGYIGSFMVKHLLDAGHAVVVIDSLERGSKDTIDKRATFFQGDLRSKEFIEDIFKNNSIQTVIHFAGYISMGESMENPGMYFEDNVLATVNLLDGMVKNNVKQIVFSSTAGVYGNPHEVPIAEDHSKNPTNPYGESKLMVERILAWYKEIFNISYVALRYFNACGASLDGDMGESHKPETHIIPLALTAILKKTKFTLFGDTYETPDGTCIRDYIHVLDLVEAHLLAVGKMEEKEGGYIYNVGTGRGYSNKEVLDMVRKVTEEGLEVETVGKRSGDADVLVANVSKIKNEMGFLTKHSDLETIVSTAWKWHKKQV